MNNKDMTIERANIAMDAYRSKHGEGKEAQLRDLICDLMHWCDCYGVDFERERIVANDFYRDETEGES